MKKFTDLTIEEKADLDSDQVTCYVDYRCAEEGAPLIPPIPEKVEETLLTKTETYFSVTLGYHDLFTEKDARDIVDFINARQGLTAKRVSGYSSPEYVVKPNEVSTYDRAQSNPKQYHTEEAAIRQEEHRQEEKLALSSYKDAKKLYDDAVSDRKEHVEYINEEISEAYDMVSAKRRYLTDWDKYLELANKDVDIASNFFIARYSTDIYNQVIVPTLEDAEGDGKPYGDTEVQHQPV